MNATRAMVYSAVLLFGGTASLAAGTLTLNGALQQLPNSLEWQSADLTFAAAEQSLSAARAATGLSLTVGGDAQVGVAVIAPSGPNAVAAGTSAASLSVSTSASLALLPWSAGFDGVRTATRSFDRARLELRDTRNALAIQLTQAYQNARIAVLDADNARSSETVAAQQLEVALAQQKNGQVSQDSADNTRKLLENAKLTTLQAAQNLELSRAQLWSAIGSSDAGQTLEPPAPISASTPTQTLELLIQTALSQRVDVLKAVSKVGDAEDALNVAARNRLLPSGSLGLSFGQQGSGGTNLSSNLGIATGNLSVTGSAPLTGSNTAATSLTVSASANIAVVDPSSDAKIRSASLSLDSSRKSLTATRQAAALDVRQKYADAALQLRRYTYQQQVLANAVGALQTARTRLSLGSVTALEVAQAQVTVAQAQRDLENQLGTRYLSAIRLENAIGTYKGESK